MVLCNVCDREQDRHYSLIYTGRGGIFSCQVDSNNSKPAATDTRMFPRWDWFDEMAMPPFIWLRGLKSPEWITEVRISYLQWLCHEEEMHLLMYAHTNRAIGSTYIYPDPYMQMYAKYHIPQCAVWVVLCSAWWVVHRLASTPQCIIFLQSTNKILISNFDWIKTFFFFFLLWSLWLLFCGVGKQQQKHSRQLLPVDHCLKLKYVMRTSNICAWILHWIHQQLGLQFA